MTLKIRRILLNILLIPAILAFIATSLAWVAWTQGLYPGNYTIPALTYQWWNLTGTGGISDLYWAMGGLSFISIFSIVAELLFRRRFGRSPSSELFFLRLFLLILSFQAIRLLVPLAANGLIDSVWAANATRVAWVGRLLGLCILINVGLYSGEIPFRSSGAILGSGALAVMAIAISIPLDSTQIMGNLLVRSGAHSSLALLCLIVDSLSVLTLIGTAYSQRKNRYYILAVMLLLIAFGNNMLFFVSIPLIIPGAVMMVAGTIGFAAEIRKIYLWV